MRFTPTTLQDAVLIDLDRRSDPRGWFARIFCETESTAAGLTTRFLRSNASANPRAGTLRGIHHQHPPHAAEGGLRYDDPGFAIAWSRAVTVISDKEPPGRRSPPAPADRGARTWW